MSVLYKVEAKVVLNTITPYYIKLTVQTNKINEKKTISVCT